MLLSELLHKVAAGPLMCHHSGLGPQVGPSVESTEVVFPVAIYIWNSL